ncbi:hypothetical protein [Brucella anthropi]|uniref:hypothetical protein n=1 Tax=Brucella anthropi TaxID=529 RepID=UPI0011B03713|nr:hypothetical protein [Ochrobactrum sp. MYb49]
MEKWKSWAIGIGAVWVLLAFIAWQTESDCGMFLSAECTTVYWNWVRNFVLLRWLYDFQTLLAGFAAIAGGAFVLFGAKLNSQESRNEINRSQRRASSIACSLIHDEFRDAVLNITNTKYDSFSYLDPATRIQPEDVFKHLSAHLHQLHYVSPSLGSLVSAVYRDFNKLCTPDLRKVDHPKRSHTTVQCLLMIQLLLEVEKRLKPDGTFPVGEERVPAGHLVQQLKRRKLAPEQLIGYYSLFDWDAESGNQSS